MIFDWKQLYESLELKNKNNENNWLTAEKDFHL